MRVTQEYTRPYQVVCDRDNCLVAVVYLPLGWNAAKRRHFKRKCFGKAYRMGLV